jgi:hypothetical protein
MQPAQAPSHLAHSVVLPPDGLVFALGEEPLYTASGNIN